MIFLLQSDAKCLTVKFLANLSSRHLCDNRTWDCFSHSDRFSDV